MNVIRNLFKVALLSAGVAVFGGSLTGSAATANVLVGSGGLVFTPATTNIAVNDRVIWTWAGNNHSTTSDTNGLWDSLVNNSPHSFTNTFTSAGTFPYHCTIHVSFGMKGTIIVASPNVPPTVSITNPVSGTVFRSQHVHFRRHFSLSLHHPCQLWHEGHDHCRIAKCAADRFHHQSRVRHGLRRTRQCHHPGLGLGNERHGPQRAIPRRRKRGYQQGHRPLLRRHQQSGGGQLYPFRHRQIGRASCRERV